MTDILKRDKGKSTKAKEEILLGVDYGESNIGLAFGRAGLAAPIKIIPAKNTDTALKEISRVALENKVTQIIAGLPLTVDNKETKQSQNTRQFFKLLKIHLKLPVVFVNEYQTSMEAVKSAIAAGVPQKGRRGVDDISAALILKKYYDERE